MVDAVYHKIENKRAEKHKNFVDKLPKSARKAQFKKTNFMQMGQMIDNEENTKQYPESSSKFNSNNRSHLSFAHHNSARGSDFRGVARGRVEKGSRGGGRGGFSDRGNRGGFSDRGNRGGFSSRGGGGGRGAGRGGRGAGRGGRGAGRGGRGAGRGGRGAGRGGRGAGRGGRGAGRGGREDTTYRGNSHFQTSGKGGPRPFTSSKGFRGVKVSKGLY